MLDPPALSTALLNDELIVKVCSLGDFKASVCCFVYDRLALFEVPVHVQFIFLCQ